MTLTFTSKAGFIVDIRPRGVEVWLPLVFPLVMSSADLNNGSPDFRHPEKADSVDELTRVYGGIAPRIFFSQLVQDFRPARSLQPELERAGVGSAPRKRAEESLCRVYAEPVFDPGRAAS